MRPLRAPTLCETVCSAAGSTIDVGSMDVTLDTVNVDGVRVKGGTSAFRRAGVNVIGSGALRSGPPQGTMVTLR